MYLTKNLENKQTKRSFFLEGTGESHENKFLGYCIATGKLLNLLLIFF